MKNARIIILLSVAIIFSCENRSNSRTNLRSNGDGSTSNTDTIGSRVALFGQNQYPKKIPDNLYSITWLKKIADTCESILTFGNNKIYTFDNCEMDNTEYGIFEIRNDTLVLVRQGAYEDSLYAENSPHRVGKARYKLIYTDEGFRYISLENWVNDEWVLSKYPIEDSPPFMPMHK